MKDKAELINLIIQSLHNQGALKEGNYKSIDDQFKDVRNVLLWELNDYIIVEGHVLD